MKERKAEEMNNQLSNGKAEIFLMGVFLFGN